MNRDWAPDPGEPCTLRRDLIAGHHAVMNFDGRTDKWVWAVLRDELPTCNELWVADGLSDTEEQARIAVANWELNFHRHALVLYRTELLHWWTYRCRVCHLDGQYVAASLPTIHRQALADPDHEECEPAWQEEMVGVR